ncbi:MAG TPA: hypothetical protein VGG06_28140 [Thermoanaerobaculia bacterium]|jgi:hypothetical protein
MTENATLTIEEARLEPQEDLGRLQRKAWLVGGAAAVALAVGYLTAEPADFFRAYLIGWLFCLGVAMGLSGINMLNHMSGGDWGVSLRRVLEASGRTLPYFLVTGVPLAFGLADVYHWAMPGGLDPASSKARYLLNPAAFLIWSAVILIVWTILAYALSAFSHRYEATGEERHRVRMKRLSGAGLVIYVLTGTIASVLWIMSLDPHWFSSLFGFIFVAGQGLSAFAFAVPALLFLAARQPFRDRVAPKTIVKLFHDYGKLMLAFVALWAYFMMSQFLIIWSGNLPEEVTWYLDRAGAGWLWISVLLVLGHFVLPFIVLLSQDLKKHGRRLLWVALWLLAMRWFDLYWQVAPSASHEHVVFTWMEPVAPIALGGLWLGLLAGQLKNRALLPVREPELAEVLVHG